VQNPIPFEQRITCTIKEGCAYSGLGRTTIYKEIGAGRIETTWVGKRQLIKVRSFLKRLGVHPDPAPHSAELDAQ